MPSLHVCCPRHTRTAPRSCSIYIFYALIFFSSYFFSLYAFFLFPRKVVRAARGVYGAARGTGGVSGGATGASVPWSVTHVPVRQGAQRWEINGPMSVLRGRLWAGTRGRFGRGPQESEPGRLWRLIRGSPSLSCTAGAGSQIWPLCRKERRETRAKVPCRPLLPVAARQ